MTSIRAVVTALTAALLMALVPLVAAAQDEPAPPEEVGWTLDSYFGGGSLVDVPAGVVATLLLEGGQATGNGGCNSFFGSYHIDGSTISFDDAIGRTLMLCEGDAQVVEDAYLATLPTAVSWSIEDGALRLDNAGGEVVLAFGAGMVDVPQADIGQVLALLNDLQVQVGALEERVATLEGEPVAEPARGPRAPGPRGAVETVFPEYLRDPSTPPSEIEDKDREIVRWRDRSDDEDGFVVYARRGYCVLRAGVDPNQALGESDFRLQRGETVQVDSLPADSRRYRPDHEAIDARLPEKPVSPYSNDEFYDLLVAAHSEAGESRRILVASYFLTPEFRCP